MSWDMTRAPVWLRVWRLIPFIDRFAYPVMVRRHVAYLVPEPAWPEGERDPVPVGWLVVAAQPAERRPLALFPQKRPTAWVIRLWLAKATRRFGGRAR